jgi:toxin YhaV
MSISLSANDWVRSMSSKRTKRAITPPAAKPVEKNGWTLFAHPLILDQIDRLEGKARSEDDPQDNATKVLKWVTEAIFDTIPQDPMREMYRLGDALGKKHTHWFRDHYAGRFRLFFRFNSAAKVIIFAWVNDENTLRTYGSKTDAYAVFKGMLDDKNPPGGWAELLKECSTGEAVKRLNGKRAKNR